MNVESLTVPGLAPLPGKAQFTMIPNPAKDIVNFNFVPEESGELKIRIAWDEKYKYGEENEYDENG